MTIFQTFYNIINASIFRTHKYTSDRLGGGAAVITVGVYSSIMFIFVCMVRLNVVLSGQRAKLVVTRFCDKEQNVVQGVRQR